MLNSMNHFIKLQFSELYNFDYKITLKENLTTEELNSLEDIYGSSTSQTLGIEIKDKDNNRVTNNIFVTDAGDLVRFKDKNNNYIKIDSNDGVYVTSKLAETNSYNISTYLTAIIGTFVVSYLVLKRLARKVNKIDMVSSLKGNE